MGSYARTSSSTSARLSATATPRCCAHPAVAGPDLDRDGQRRRDAPVPGSPPRLSQPTRAHATVAESTPAGDGLLGGHDLDRRRARVRFRPSQSPRCCSCFDVELNRSSDARSAAGVAPEEQRCFECDKPFLSLCSPTSDARTAQATESHTISVGTRREGDEPDA